MHPYMYFCTMKSDERILALEHEKLLLQEENKRLQEELQRNHPNAAAQLPRKNKTGLYRSSVL